MLCSRANTREEAAMSGSIAAFVLIKSLGGESATALDNLKWNFCVGIHLPQRDASIFHYSFPRGRQSPTSVRITLERSARVAEKTELFTILENLHYFDLIIGKPFEVAAPAGEHFLAADDFIAVRVDECVIVAHQFGQGVRSASIDRIDKSDY